MGIGMSRICKKCGYQMDYDSLFCSKCGVKYIKYNDKIFTSESMRVAVVQWEVFLDEGKPFICIKISSYCMYHL